MFFDVLGKTSATWEFAAVSPNLRHKGVGKKIFQFALDAYINGGAEIIVTTLIEKTLLVKNSTNSLVLG